MKFLRVLFFIFLLNSSLCANAEVIKLAPKEIIDDYMEMADTYAFAGDYQKALEYINMVVHFEPMNPTARYKQALLLTTLNKNDEAREIFTQALKLNPKFANSELAVLLKQDDNKALSSGETIYNTPIEQSSVNIITQQEEKNIETQTKQKEETKNIIIADEPQQKIVPYSSEYYNQMGLQYLNEGDNKNAYDYLLKAVEIDKHNFEALNNLGLFYWQQGENKLAEEQFKKAIRVNSKSCKPLLNLGLLYKEMGKDKKYYDYINKALKLEPKNYLANWIVGNYYAETARPIHAISLYKKAIDLNPEFYDGYISLGNIYAATGSFEEAYELFKKALNINSVDPNLYYILSKTASILDKNIEAKDYILKGLELSQNDKFYLELAKITSNMGDYEESLEILMKYFSETTDPEILNYIGLAYYKIKQPEIAIRYFQKLIDIDKSKTTYLYNLALCYKSLGNREKFFKYVDMATKILPKNPQDYIDLSYIYFDNGNKSFALNVLNDGILQYPNDKKLYMAKLSLFKTCGDMKNYIEFKTIVDTKFNN